MFKNATNVTARARTSMALIFLLITALIYFGGNLLYLVNPSADPLNRRVGRPPTTAVMVVYGLLLCYGLFCLLTRSKLFGKAMGLIIIALFSSRLLFATLFIDSPLFFDRLAGTIEGGLATVYLGAAILFSKKVSPWH